MGRNQRRQRWTALFIASAVVAITACETSGGSAAPRVVRGQGTPVIADTRSGPGTQLGDGFSVPEGASLIGAALPDDLASGYADFPYQRAWSALLLITGDARAVTMAFLHQAAVKGMGSAATFAYCSENRCETGASTPVQNTHYRSQVRVLGIDISPGASLMTLTYRDHDPAREYPPIDAPVAGSLPLTGRTEPGPVKLPRVGDEIQLTPADCIRAAGCTEAQYLRTEVRVEPESQPLAPAFCSGCYGNDVLLMRVTDGKRVLDAYAAATKRLNAWEGPEYQAVRQHRDGWTVHTRGFNNTDTGVWYELFTKPGSPQYLRLSMSNGA